MKAAALAGLEASSLQVERQELEEAHRAVRRLPCAVSSSLAPPTPPPASASFLLDTPGISRQGRGTLDESPDLPLEHPARTAWLAEVEAATTAHREYLARGYELRGKSRLNRKWYLARARGQRERFENVRGCQRGDLVHIVCSCCGVASTKAKRCATRVCLSCRAHRIAKDRARFATARQSVLWEARARGLLNRFRRGGRYSEKMLTLTLPHREEDSVRARIDFVHAAWPHFLKRVNAWMRDREEEWWWLRHHEWEPGSDGQGHPHIPVWFLGPYIAHELLEDFWRESLEAVGFDATTLVVDIRAVRNGEVDEGKGIVTEVVKYMTKDIIKPGTFVPAETFARVYEGYDGRRVAQASKGFLARAERPKTCPHCEAREPYLVKVGDEGCWRGSLEAKRAFAESELRLRDGPRSRSRDPAEHDRGGTRREEVPPATHPGLPAK